MGLPRLTAIIPSLGLGGAERSLVRLANAFARHHWSVDLVIFTAAAKALFAELHPDVGRHIIGIAHSSNPLLWVVVRRMLKRLRPDVVLGWSTYANLVACLNRWPGDPWGLILSERNYIPEIYHPKRLARFRRMMTLQAIRRLYRRADVITANSQANCRYLEDFIGRGAAYQYLPNIADPSWQNLHGAPPCDLPRELRGPKLLALGRLDHQKGFDIALEAMARVCSVKPWSLVIVGEGAQGERLERQAELLGLNGSVHWLGARINPLPYYRWADVVIVPSRFEGFPNVALEAMVCGCAVICTNCMTGPAELTAGGRYGVLVPCEDPDALAKAIIALGDDPVRRRSLGEAAARFIAETYHVDHVWPRIEKIFMSSLET
jgi:glycosyltransferase involved in cell wall biosynthesis